jgi:hypothetical protein
MFAVRDETISPADCLVAVGFPLDERNYRADLADGCNKDFAKSIQRSLRLNEQEYLGKIRAFLALCNKNLDEMSELGATVLPNFRFSDLGLSAKYRVFVILSHFKPSKLLSSDILDISAIDSIMQNNPTLFNRVPGGNPNGTDKKMRLEELNSLLDDATFYKSAGADSFLTGSDEKLPAVYIRYLNRMVLDKFFEGVLSRGNMVELYDGLYSVEEIVARIPFVPKQVIDLSFCHSMIVQDALKRAGSDRHAFGVEMPLSLNFKVIFLKGLMELLSKQPGPYVSSFFKLSADIKKKLTNQ